MWYVYCKHVTSGREGYIGIFPTFKEAVHKIASCYAIDKRICQEDEYYYFTVKR